MLDFIAYVPEVRAHGEVVEGDLVADAPVSNREPIVGVPQHRLADAVIKRENRLFPFDDGGVRAPGHPVYGVIHDHVGREDFLVLSRPFQVHMPPEVEEDGPM